jgi:2-hydroxy-3-keto-5-methylthiopentenyl-1-phosphate phosphatase
MLKEILKKTKNPLVVSDFDGTISLRDISYELLEKFSHGGWEDIDKAYINGEIGSKEAFSMMLERIKAKKSELTDFISKITSIDPHFKEFCRYLKDLGIDLVVVSDGFEFYIRTLLEKEGIYDIPIFANDIKEDKDGKLIPIFPHHNKECDKCGNCKRDVIKSLMEEHDYLIFIGDGYSDKCPSELADTLFAKRFLYQHAAREEIPAVYFRGFDDITREFEKEIKGVIFDLDETLVNSIDAIKTAFVYTIEKLKLDTDIERTFVEMMHWPLTTSFEKLFPGVDLKELVDVFRKKYYSIYKEMTPVKDGMRDLLLNLTELGIKLSVATNKHGQYARELISHLGIGDLFCTVVGAGDVENPKPATDMIDAAMVKMDTKKEDTVFVGDSIVDIEAAKNSQLDIYCLAQSISTPEQLAEKRPRKIFYNTEDLKNDLISSL